MRLAKFQAMNASPLLLSPSGHPDISPSTPDTATAKKSTDPAGGDSTFAGALKNAGPKPSRRSAPAKAAAGDSTGSALPVAGKHSPPPVPQADIHAAIAQQAGVAATAAGAAANRPAGGEGSRGEPDAITGPAAGATPGTGAEAASGPAGLAAESTAAGATAQAAASGQTTGQLNGAFNNLLGMPATAGSAGVGGTAAAAGEAVAATAGSTAGSTAVTGAGSTAGLAAAGAPGMAAAAAASPASAGKPSLKASSPAIRSGIGSAAGTTTAAGGGGLVDAASANGSSALGGADGLSIAASGAAPAVADLAVPAAAGAQASAQAGDPTAAAATANLAVAAGLGVVVATSATAPSTTVALAAARAAAIAAAGTASAQGAAALATGAEDDKRAHAATEPAAPGSAGGDAVAGLFQLGPTTTGPSADAGATPTFQLHPSLDSGELAQGLSDRVTYLVDNGLNGAKLQVNPPQLGPIELRIAVSGGHAQVWMTTHSAVTRDALESSSPKLREMLGAQGFGQVSVDISQRSFQDRSAQARPYQRMATERLTAATAEPAVNRAAPHPPPGGLDAYA